MTIASAVRAALMGTTAKPSAQDEGGVLPERDQVGVTRLSDSDRTGVDPPTTPRLVLPVREHVVRLVDCAHQFYEPGDAIEHCDMRALYDFLTDRDGLVPRPWNSVARDLKARMGRGPRGGRKTYQRLLRSDGSTQQVRIWLVPEVRQVRIEQSRARPTHAPTSGPLAREPRRAAA